LDKLLIGCAMMLRMLAALHRGAHATILINETFSPGEWDGDGIPTGRVNVVSGAYEFSAVYGYADTQALCMSFETRGTNASSAELGWIGLSVRRRRERTFRQ
jgi:hypothetical protein